MQIGITFECPCHGSLCWLQPPGERIAGCRNAYGEQECRIVARCLFRARRRHVIAACEKMSIRHASVHAEHVRIERAQAHGTRDVLKCEVRLTSPDPQPGTKRPSLRCVGIDRQSPIHESRSVVELLGYKGECISTHTQRNRVFATQMHCFPGHPHTLRAFLNALVRPTKRLTPPAYPRGPSISAGQTRVELV